MRYRERVTPPAYLILLGALAGASFGLILAPLSGTAAAATAVVLAAAVAAFAVAASPVIEVTDTGFRAGSARIESEFLGEVTELDKAGIRRRLGVEADARAYVLHRAYATGAVQVSLRDPRDPAPYWLVSTNRPTELHAALRELGGRSQSAHSEQTGSPSSSW